MGQDLQNIHSIRSKIIHKTVKRLLKKHSKMKNVSKIHTFVDHKLAVNDHPTSRLLLNEASFYNIDKLQINKITEFMRRKLSSVGILSTEKRLYSSDPLWLRSQVHWWH